MVSISKQFEVKPTVDGMIESSFAISSLACSKRLDSGERCGVKKAISPLSERLEQAISSLSRVTTPKSIGMHSKKKYVESVRRVSPEMKYLGDFLTKDVATRELEPAKLAS